MVLRASIDAVEKRKIPIIAISFSIEYIFNFLSISPFIILSFLLKLHLTFLSLQTLQYHIIRELSLLCRMLIRSVL